MGVMTTYIDILGASTGKKIEKIRTNKGEKMRKRREKRGKVKTKIWERKN